MTEENKKTKLQEAYVGVPQQYSLPTEQLTQRTKKTHQAIYERAVEQMNSISFKLEGADRHDANPTNSVYRSLKRDESAAINRSFLHALYFDNISDLRSQITTDMISFHRLSRDWGSFDRWQEDFIATCLSSRNGWGVTAFCYLLNRYINIVVDEESDGVPFGCIPVIVMDMHEHAYFHDYLGDSRLYVNAMMLEFDWEVINARIERTERVSGIMQPKVEPTSLAAGIGKV
jgi:superoxide dismutase, Fe-Mn family